MSEETGIGEANPPQGCEQNQGTIKKLRGMLIMDLDKQKAKWLEEKRQYLLEMSPKQRAAEIRRKAEEIEKKYKRSEREKLWLGMLGLALLASLFRPHGPLAANAGIGILILCGAMALKSYFILKHRFEKFRRDLPRKEYLAEQRTKIITQIKLVERTMIWLLIPGFAGLALHLSAQFPSRLEIIPFVIIAIIGCAAGVLCGRKIVRKKLLPILEDIERELAGLDLDKIRSNSLP
jgi:hypothetical protein